MNINVYLPNGQTVERGRVEELEVVGRVEELEVVGREEGKEINEKEEIGR